MGAVLEWRGDEIAERIERAAEVATREVVSECVADAGANTPVLTGAARDSLHAEVEGLEATWGYGVDYGIWIEIGARGHAGQHALRRAADRHYPEMVPKIRSHAGLIA